MRSPLRSLTDRCSIQKASGFGPGAFYSPHLSAHPHRFRFRIPILAKSRLRSLREQSAKSIVKIVLHELATIVLLIAMFGANTAMASICEAYCVGTGKHAEHHDMSSIRNSSPNHHRHAKQDQAECSKCPTSSFSVQLPPCERLTQFQSLQTSLRVFSDRRLIEHLDLVKSSGSSFAAPVESERFSTFHPPPKLSDPGVALVSLRI